jgi:hypothetical protein
MQVGDLVVRKNQLGDKEFGIVLSKQMGGSNPVHPCVTVFYPRIGKTYDMAEALMEVISESN